jgi:hypothetical protein
VDVIIHELTSTVEVTSDDVLLDPGVLRQVVHAVLARLRDDEATREWEQRERRLDEWER